MITYTRIELADPKRGGKHYSITPEGKIEKSSIPYINAGHAYVERADDMAAFATVLNDKLQPGQDVLIYGRPVRDVGEEGIAIRAANKMNGTDAIQRSNEDFRWPEGATIFAMDYDPRDGHDVLTRDALWEQLSSTFPALSGGDVVWGASSSSHIFNGDEEVVGLKGQRLYFAAADGTDIERAAEVMLKRMWLAGHGYILISGSGGQLIRATTDPCMYQASRLDFAAGAVCNNGLEQKRPDAFLINTGSALIDTRAAFPDLTSEEEARYAELIKEAKAATAEEAQAVQKKWLDAQIRQEVIRDNPDAADIDALCAQKEKRKRELLRAVNGENDTLGLDHLLWLSDGRTVSVREVVTQSHLFDGVKCRDPLEPDYRGGSITGMIYGPGRRLVSHAHGLKRIYKLADVGDEQFRAATELFAKLRGPVPDELDEYSTAALRKVHLRRSPPLVENLIAPHLTYLVGDPKAGKSFLAMQIANAISKGDTIFGCEVPQKRRALYFAVENGYEETVDRIQNMGLDGDVVWRFKGKNFEAEPDSVEELLVMLTDEVMKDASIGVIFLDTLRFMAGPPPKVDGGNAQDRDYAQLKPIQSWCQTAGVGVVALAHTNKAQDGRGGLRTQIASTAGSNLIMGTAESILTLSRHVDRDTMANLAHGLIQRTGRSFKDDTALEVTFDGSKTSFVMTSDHEKAAIKVMQKARTNSCRRAIAKELLNKSEGVERDELRDKVVGELGVSRQAFHKAVGGMIAGNALKERDGRFYL